MPEMIQTSLITLTHNHSRVTQQCLPPFLVHSGTGWEWIIVDNGSTDETPAWLLSFQKTAARHGVDVTLLLHPLNRGCSTARNQAVHLARGRYLIFTDNDVTIRSRGWLQGLLRELDADPTIGMVGPKLVYPVPPHPIQCAGVGISRRGRVQFVGRGEPRDDPRFAVRREVQALISACIAVRRELFDQLGGFDEVFNPVQFEDLDLCYRARSRGWRLLYVPTVEMYHLESVTTAGTPHLPNPALVVRHGLLFQQRWAKMFSTENGPSEEDTRWRHMPPTDVDHLGALPVVD